MWSAEDAVARRMCVDEETSFLVWVADLRGYDQFFADVDDGGIGHAICAGDVTHAALVVSGYGEDGVVLGHCVSADCGVQSGGITF